MTGQPPGPGIWDGQPAATWADAFLAGNGRHGALVFGQPWDETVIVTQHRLVRPNGTAGQPPPRLAGRLAEVRALLLAGDSAAALDRLSAGWPEHPPQPFHPAFAVRLALKAMGPVTGYQRAVDFAAGLVSAEWTGPDQAVRAADVLRVPGPGRGRPARDGGAGGPRGAARCRAARRAS